MKYSDWMLISTFGFFLGGLSVAGALFAHFYYVTYGGAFGLSIRDYPYRDYFVPLLLVGVVLLVTGLATGLRAREELNVGERKPIPYAGYCPICGTRRDRGAQYCKKCGKKFE